MRGGTVQVVYSDTVNVSVAVLDYDEIAPQEATPEFIKLEAETKGMLGII
jgi:gamma-glutamyltranspeptidase